MDVHRIDWSTATVEAGQASLYPDLTLRVTLEGKSTDAWRARFLGIANQRTSLDEPWGQIELKADEIIVQDLKPEKGPYFLGLIHGRLHRAVGQADQRRPLPEDDVDPDFAADVGADPSIEPERRAKELTDHLRAQLGRDA